MQVRRGMVDEPRVVRKAVGDAAVPGQYSVFDDALRAGFRGHDGEIRLADANRHLRPPYDRRPWAAKPGLRSAAFACHHTNRTSPMQTKAWVRSLSLSP
jgi:hypothetical protein